MKLRSARSAAGHQIVALRRSDGRIDVLGTDANYHFVNVPPFEPGTSCLQLSGNWYSFAARMGSTCTYVGYLPGCAGSMPAAPLIPHDTPRIGRPFGLRLRNLPLNLAALAMGFDKPAVPIALGPIGMPGCALGIDIDAVVVLSGQDHEVELHLPIPDVASLVGVRFYQQALVLDPQAGNTLGAVMSDAAEGIVGYP